MGKFLVMFVVFTACLFLSEMTHALQFELVSEDGSLKYSCETFQKDPGGPRWDLQCGKQRFAVHFVIKKFPQAHGVLRHQILYWVLDYQERPDPSLAGTYHGTNMSVNLLASQPPQTMELGQIVQTTWNLNVKFSL